jgi:hypothetical protein
VNIRPPFFVLILTFAFALQEAKAKEKLKTNAKAIAGSSRGGSKNYLVLI